MEIMVIPSYSPVSSAESLKQSLPSRGGGALHPWVCSLSGRLAFIEAEL